jgi:hypothetical protein
MIMKGGGGHTTISTFEAKGFTTKMEVVGFLEIFVAIPN